MRLASKTLGDCRCVIMAIERDEPLSGRRRNDNRKLDFQMLDAGKVSV